MINRPVTVSPVKGPEPPSRGEPSAHFERIQLTKAVSTPGIWDLSHAAP